MAVQDLQMLRLRRGGCPGDPLLDLPLGVPKGQKKHMNFFNIKTVWPLPTNPHFAPLRPKSVYVPHVLGKSEKTNPHKLFRLIAGPKRGSQTALLGHKSYVYCFFFPGPARAKFWEHLRGHLWSGASRQAECQTTFREFLRKSRLEMFWFCFFLVWWRADLKLHALPPCGDIMGVARGCGM